MPAKTAPHGTASRYGNGRCRCEECTAAAGAARQRWVASLAARAAETPHGTASGYRNWGCRCEDCATAAGRRVRPAPPPEPRKISDTPFAEIPHATTDGWKKYRCACDGCAQQRAADLRARKRRDYHAAKARRAAENPPPEPEVPAAVAAVTAQRRAMMTRPGRKVRDGTE